jgi:hypothetical protein
MQFVFRTEFVREPPVNHVSCDVDSGSTAPACCPQLTQMDRTHLLCELRALAGESSLYEFTAQRGSRKGAKPAKIWRKEDPRISATSATSCSKAETVRRTNREPREILRTVFASFASFAVQNSAACSRSGLTADGRGLRGLNGGLALVVIRDPS